MRKLAWSCAAIVIVWAAAAVAQTAAPVACPQPQANIARQKTLQCSAYFRKQGLRGDDLVNNTAVCVAQARLTCLQQAAANHVTKAGRVQFLASCLGT